MDQEFDPYLELLGIPKSEQPPNCYRLLGIPEYTSNKQVIANGAARQMQFLRRVGGDQYLTEVQAILNEISKVRIILLDDDKRTEYDRNLKAKDRGGKELSGSGSDSLSRSQSQFDLLAPVQKERGRVATVQLIFLSGPRVGEVKSVRRRDITLGPSSRFDVMLPTRNGAVFKLEHEIDQWILSSEDTSFAVNGRLVNGLTTVKNGDILRFSADGPDLQFVDEVDLIEILGTLDQYEHIVSRSSSNLSNPSISKSAASGFQQAPKSKSQQSVATAQKRQQSRPSTPTAAARSAAAAQPTRPHQSRLVKKPDSQKSQGIASSIITIANRALGKEDKFTKKTGIAFDWQIGVFWLAVGGTLAAIIALILYALKGS